MTTIAAKVTNGKVKISRIQRGTDFEDEDTVRDLIGYLVLRLIAEESE